MKTPAALLPALALRTTGKQSTVQLGAYPSEKEAKAQWVTLLADFPWLGIWEENASRTAPPWNGTALTRGMEFGVSPFPESRRQMIDRGQLFGVPAYRWIAARGVVEVEYWAVLRAAAQVPEVWSIRG